MRDLKAPWYVHVSANDDVEIRNNKGEFVMVYYNHDVRMVRSGYG